MLPCTQSRAFAVPSRLSLHTQMSLWMRRLTGTSERETVVHEPLVAWLRSSFASASIHTRPKRSASA